MSNPEIPVLLGTNRSYAWVQFGTLEAQLGAIVAATQASSGRTVQEWNALSGRDRDALIDAFIEQERTAMEAGEPASITMQPIASIDAPALLGNERAYAAVQIGDAEVHLSTLVQGAHAFSGLSNHAWNELPPAERDQHIDAWIEQKRAEANAQKLAQSAESTQVDSAAQIETVNHARGQTTSYQHVDELAHIEVPTLPVVQPEENAAHTEFLNPPAVESPAVVQSAPEAAQPAAEQPSTPAAAPAPATDNESSPVASNDDTPALPDGFSPAAQTFLQGVLSYIPAMHPKRPVTEADRLRQQVSLYRSISGVLNKLEGEEFTRAYGFLLELFSLYRKGVFGERYVYRDFDNVPLAEPDRRAFQRFLMLLTLTADPKSRAVALKQIDMTKTLALGVSEPARQRVQAFYGV